MNKINLIQTDPLPSPLALLNQLPLPFQEAQFIEKRRGEIAQILDREDPRIHLIVRPLFYPLTSSLRKNMLCAWRNWLNSFPIHF